MRSAKNPRPPYFGCTISAGAACESRNFPFSDIENNIFSSQQRLDQKDRFLPSFREKKIHGNSVEVKRCEALGD
jgi:hypothetical protein